MNSPLPDDTQPKSPFKPLPGEGRRPPRYIDPEEPPPSRAGCGLMGLMTSVVMLFALVIVLLAGAAGWTSGQREAAAAATSTQGAAIQEQLNRIPQDIESGNTVLLDTRLRFLQSLGVPQANDLVPTATALYLSLLPTNTPTTTPTLSPSPTAAAPDATAVPTLDIAQSTSGGYDLNQIYQQAQSALSSGQYQDAISYLDVIISADETFNSADVRSLMSQALNARALELYNANQPAAANLIVDRAREFGPLQDGLEYESYAATLWLNARAAVGTGYASAISALQQVVNLGAGGRYYNDAVSLLFQQYVSYGDALGVQGQWCPAVDQYRNALSILSSGSVNAKLQNANNLCTNGTPTPDPLLGQPSAGSSSGQPIAPIGVPGS